jgi:hypothetical protein
MKDENSGFHAVDGLLKGAFKDDLPMQTEIAMKRRLDIFREKLEELETQRRRIPLKKNFLTGVLFNRGTLAFASLLMLVIGSLLQTTGPGNLLADSISARNTAFHIFNRVRSIDSMKCIIEMFIDGEKRMTYLIEWLPGNRYRAKAVPPGRSGDDIPWLNEDECKDNYLFDRVRSFLSPADLGELLDGKWTLNRYKRVGECEYGIFTVSDLQRGCQSEVTADLCTWLPVTMEIPSDRVKLEVRFMWNAPPTSPLFVPGIYNLTRRQ